jgi:hypothetical protein
MCVCVSNVCVSAAVCANDCTDDTSMCSSTALCDLYRSTHAAAAAAAASSCAVIQCCAYCCSIACPTRTNDSAGMPCVSLSSKDDVLSAVVCDIVVNQVTIA